MDPDGYIGGCESTAFLLKQSLREQHQTKAFQKLVDDTRVSVIGVAFSIYVAYVVERFYEHLGGYLIFGYLLTHWETFWLNWIWFCLMLVCYPLTWMYMSGPEPNASRRRPFFTDVKALWRVAVKTMVSDSHACIQPPGCLPKLVLHPTARLAVFACQF